jgi:8-oxo-dGTP diphosphatase
MMGRHTLPQFASERAKGALKEPQQSSVVVAGLLRQGQQLLLIHQQGPYDRAPYWSLPGGKVEPGELLSDALVREVREETGLTVLRIGPLAYIMHADILLNRRRSPKDPRAASRQIIAFVYEVSEWKGTLAPADPDELILEACFFLLPTAITNLHTIPVRTAREPILAYLLGEAPNGATWLYRRSLDKTDHLIARL